MSAQACCAGAEDVRLVQRLSFCANLCDALRNRQDPWPVVEAALANARYDAQQLEFVRQAAQKLIEIPRHP